jgi:hypothetical protein
MSVIAIRLFQKVNFNKWQNRFVVLIIGIVFFQVLFINSISAQGNLLITPRRVVLEGNKKSIDLNLANTGKDTATYSISLVHIRMTESGGFEQITEPDPGQNFADKYLRFFPRVVTLAPNEAQVVKVQLVRTNDLAPGEYRSHFYFRAVPSLKPLGEIEKKTDTTSISVSLKPIFGITIPAIIRVGDLSVKVAFSDVVLEMAGDTIPRLKMVFIRTGDKSIYGDLSVDYVSPNGTKTRVGVANGIAVYTPNTKRNFQLNLSIKPGVDYHSGKLVMIFSAPSDVKPEKYAETEVSLH